MEGDINPADINKNPAIIKGAKEELGKLDILVCGECHEVFHYVEQLQEHKLPANCSGVSTLRDNNFQNETKPKVWAFLLWKNAQYKDGEKENDNSWIIYQRWCKLEAQIKEAWTTAAKNVQTFTKISAAKIQEIRNQPKAMYSQVKGVPGTKNANAASAQGKGDDPLEEGEIRLMDLPDEQRTLIKENNQSKSFDEDDPLRNSDADSDTELDTDEELEKHERMLAMKKKLVKGNDNVAPKVPVVSAATAAANKQPVQINSSTTITSVPRKAPVPAVVANRKALKTNKDENTIKEYILEKILAKRFNPRRKTHEYLLKWEGCSHDENTWEPVAHMEGCKGMLDIFERNLARQKEIKAQQEAAAKAQRVVAKATPKPPIVAPSPGPSGNVTASGRPQRTSKQKALNQVKAWCGDIVDNDENGMKRRNGSSSEDDVVEKKIKIEEGNDENAKQNVTVHRIIKQVPGRTINGVNKKVETGNVAGTVTQVLGTNRGRGGAIKVDQKQMPGLSSGVYIMNKQTGIVKLDSQNVAPSSIQTRIIKGGNTLLRVAPKTVPPQIRIVQKEEENSNPSMRLSPGMSSQTVRQFVKRPGRPPVRVTSSINPNNNNNPRLVANRVSVGSPTIKILSKARPAPPNKSQVTKLPLITSTPPEDDEESDDDGLDNEEDLFPKDLPLPEPDSPPRDFTLCPLTGKVLTGQQAVVSHVEPLNPSGDSLEALVKTVTDDSGAAQTTNMPTLSSVQSSNDDESSAGNDLTAVTLDGGTSLMITGDDGTVYQVAGQNEKGQTYLVAQGADGQQQCVLVTTEQDGADGGVLTLDTAVAEAVVQMAVSNAMEVPATDKSQEEADADADDGQVVAQIVKADPPSPGGSRNVVFCMPDGTYMMTTVDADQYAAFELDEK